MNKRKLITLIIFISSLISLYWLYNENFQKETLFREMYTTVRFEFSEDRDIYKYSNHHWDLISTIDGYKKICVKTNEVFNEPYIYKLVLGYNLDESNKGETTEILFKSQSMTIDGVEYITQTKEQHKNILEVIKTYYERNDFQIYKK